MNTMKMIAIALLLMFANDINAQSKASFRMQEVIVSTGQEVEIPVIVDNPMEFNGLQMSVTLPEELTFVPYEAGKDNSRAKWAKLNPARCEDTHSVVSGKAPKNNRLTFVAYSSQNDAFVGKTGELLKFKVKTTEEAIPGVYYITMDNMEFSDMQNKSVEQDAMNIKITVVEASEATGVKHTNADAHDDNLYNIQGQRIADNNRGIVIKNSQKYIKK